VRANAVNVKYNTVNGSLNTGYYLPNLYRTVEGEK